MCARRWRSTNCWKGTSSAPPYQRNDYIGWITRAKREETRLKRLSIMLAELERGEGYMGLPYKVK